MVLLFFGNIEMILIGLNYDTGTIMSINDGVSMTMVINMYAIILMMNDGLGQQ